MKLPKTFRVGQTTNVPSGTRKLWTPLSVRMRYARGIWSAADHLSLLGRDPWTKEEDDQLWEVFQRLGNRWHAISCTLNGRPGPWAFLCSLRYEGLNLEFSSAVHCRNRLQSLQRLRAAEQVATNITELEVIPQISESPVDTFPLNVS